MQGFRDQVAFGTVDDDCIKIKFFGDTNGGADIIGTVGMEMRFDFAFQYWQ